MSGFLGAVEGLGGDMAGAMTGGAGNFLEELANVLESAMNQNSGNASAGSSASPSSNAGGSSSTGSGIGQIVGEVLPLVAAFL